MCDVGWVVIPTPESVGRAVGWLDDVWGDKTGVYSDVAQTTTSPVEPI